MLRLKILEIILNKPNLRAVDIADRLDIDAERVRPLIAADIETGSVVEEEITGPNGRPAMSFRFASEQAKAPVAAELQAASVPARVARALPPAQRPVVASNPTRADRAIAFLHERHPEPVSGVELMLAMGLSIHHSPYQTMRSSINRGRVDYTNHMWTLGPVELFKLSAGVTTEVPEVAPAPAPATMTADEWVVGADPEAAPVDLVKPEVQPDPERDDAAAWVDKAKDETPTLEFEVKGASMRFGGFAAGEGLSKAGQWPLPITGGLPKVGSLAHSPFFMEGSMVVSENGALKSFPLKIQGADLGQWDKLMSESTVSDERTMRAMPDAARASNEPKLVSGLLSDGSLHLRIPGKRPFDLSPAQAADLFDFMQVHGFTVWARKQAA